MTANIPAISRTVAAAAVLASLAAGCAAGVYPRVYMMEEDSHLHEVRPGTETRFHVPAVPARRTLDVKCTLAGPVGPVQVEFFGIEPTGWAASHPRLDVGDKEIVVAIEGVVEPGAAVPYFALVNRDPTRLLWHQCYND